MPRRRSYGRSRGIAEWGILTQQLRDAPVKARKEIRDAARQAAKPVRDAIARNASWSSRIPGAVEVKVGFGTRDAGVRVIVNERKAPHARPLEGLTAERRGGATFRHPVFGHDRWVAQPIRPFFFPAVRAQREQVTSAIEEAILRALPGS